jgi:non-canonical purine NTP pyrophosphatase, rdgB/HAM1 family
MTDDNKTFVAATNNAGKLKEIRNILKSAGFECISLKEAGIDVDVDETGATFAQNAYIKAKTIYDICGLPVIADDSGLCVDYLGGEPGIYTARYAGPEHDDDANIDKLLGKLVGLPSEQRGARFVSAVCAVLSDTETVTALGWCEGYIGTERRGSGGFGYDPVFWLKGNRSFSEISEKHKDDISHRGRAIRKLAFMLRGIKRCRMD